MKSFVYFLIIFLFFTCPGRMGAQDTTITYFSGDSVMIIENYKRNIIQSRQVFKKYPLNFSRETWFKYGIDVEEELKPYLLDKMLEEETIYYYDSTGNLVLESQRHLEGKSTRLFRYKPEDIIEISSVPENNCFGAGTEKPMLYAVTNFSIKKVCLNDDFGRQFCIESQQTINIYAETKTSTGLHYDTIRLFNDSINEIHTDIFFGYTLCSDDFNTDKKFSFTGKIYYYRTGTEALMNIYDKKKKDPVIRFPVNNFKNEFDISNLKKGKEYYLETVDYTNNQKKRIVFIANPQPPTTSDQ
ncbi:MAG: hypothetical protein ACOZCO_13960 [Bacteroidota bacterium]